MLTLPMALAMGSVKVCRMYEVGVTLSKGYNGSLTFKEAGSIGNKEKPEDRR